MYMYIDQLSNISRGSGKNSVCVWRQYGEYTHTCVQNSNHLSIAGSEPGRLHPPPSGRPCHYHLRDNSSHSTQTIS